MRLKRVLAILVVFAVVMTAIGPLTSGVPRLFHTHVTSMSQMAPRCMHAICESPPLAPSGSHTVRS